MAKPRLILVVDDSPSDALLLGRSLEKAGFGVIIANSGGVAVELATQKSPDLILLDMTMPGQDGIDTCGKLKQQAATEQIPVVFVTANSDSQSIVKAFAAGGSDYVTKPIRLDEVLARLSVHLRLRDAERDLVKRNQELESVAEQLVETNEALARQGRLDGLTNLLNRRAFDEAAQVEHDRARRHGHPYAILMLDIDYFKLLNDSLGHPEGDRCLQQVAGCVARICRASDVVARYGGEEFVVLATEVSAEAGGRLAERIRRGIWGLSLRHPTSPAGRVTVSIGVAGSEAGSLTEVLSCADRFLYRAKNSGRNLVYAGPATRTEVESAETPSEASAASPSDFAPCVLIVEDNRANRMVYRGCLQKEGYRIVETENGEEALNAVPKCRPDLILMDVMMPVMDGIECTRRLKADPDWQDIPIVIVSARDDAESVLAGFEAGAEEYVTKPVRSNELTARVRSMVRLSTERRALVRSYELRAEQIRFLTVLVDFCRTVGTAATLNEILDCLIQTVAEVTCSRRVSVMLPDADRTELRVVRSIGIDEETAQKEKFRVGEGIAAQVFATCEAVMMNTANDQAAGLPGAASGLHLIVPLLAAPIGTPSQVLGVLNVSDRVGQGRFDLRELEYVELVAGIAASAMRTIRNREARDDARGLVISALARLAEHRDSDTGRHVERVTQYSCILAEALRSRGKFPRTIDESFVRDLARAVPLHDIGKVAIPDRILLKPGSLTLDEMAVMRKHVDIGVETLRPLIKQVPDADSLRMALDVIRGHHEWYDGAGYPQGLKGEAIPLSARIVAVADVFDALTRDRVYKRAMPFESARTLILESSGTQFDPAVVEAFEESSGRFQELAIQLCDDRNNAGGCRRVSAAKAALMLP
jgi:diguanylate cyclase (GGDEF)-like protein